MKAIYVKMKTTKVSRKIGILSKFLVLGGIIALLFSCDVLESDPDVLEPTVDITGEEIYVLANGASFIDLNSKVQTNQPARLAVTSQPRHGTLADLGQGILQYSPATGSAKARDGFEFTVYSNTNEILKKDSVIIIIETDSTKLPCNIYPVTDYVYDVTAASVSIDVISNDIICSNDVVVSVYKPENSFPPYFGQAEAKENKIIYYPGTSFSGADKIMYKITDSNDPKRIAFGMVYITSDSSCSFSVWDDLYEYNTLTEGTALILTAFVNDSLCHALNEYQVNIKSGPLYGAASLVSNGFLYQFPDSIGFTFNDHFIYEVCIDADCKTARVDIKLKMDSVWTCSFYATPDSIDMVNSTVALMYLDVLNNDSTCDSLKSFALTKMPMYGTAFVNEEKKAIGYERDPLMNKDDTLEYEICDGKECSTASVFIKRTN